MTKSKKKTSTNSQQVVSEVIKESTQIKNQSAASRSLTTKKLVDKKLEIKNDLNSVSTRSGTGEAHMNSKTGKPEDKKGSAQSPAKKDPSDEAKKRVGDNQKIAGKLSDRPTIRSGNKDSLQKSEQTKSRSTVKKWSSSPSSDKASDTKSRRDNKPWTTSNRNSNSFSETKNRGIEKNETKKGLSRDFQSQKAGDRFLKKDTSTSDPRRRPLDSSTKPDKRSDLKPRLAEKKIRGSARNDSARNNSANRTSTASQDTRSRSKSCLGESQSTSRPRRTTRDLKAEDHNPRPKSSIRAKSWQIVEETAQKNAQESISSSLPGIRIQKWLSQQGVASRREAEEWIAQGLVYVNGKLVTEQGQRIDPTIDQVRVTGKHIHTTPPPRVYWLLHKPDMVLTSRPDGTGRASIYELESTRDLQFLVSPVGRLDYRTEGLLLLSNDGELVHRLCHPKYKVPRMYNVLTDGRLSPEEEKALRRGITLEDGPTGRSEILFAHGVNLGKSRGYWYFVTVFEGRNRLVRRMFEHFGLKVVRLVRYGFGDLRLPDDLPPGEYRQLTPAEIKYLKETVGLSGEEG